MIHDGLNLKPVQLSDSQGLFFRPGARQKKKMQRHHWRAHHHLRRWQHKGRWLCTQGHIDPLNTSHVMTSGTGNNNGTDHDENCVYIMSLHMLFFQCFSLLGFLHSTTLCLAVSFWSLSCVPEEWRASFATCQQDAAFTGTRQDT